MTGCGGSTNTVTVSASSSTTASAPAIVARGHGESDPVAPNELNGKDNPEGRAKNRRVTLAYPHG